MNSFIRAVTSLDLDAVTKADPKWITWAEPSGKNALHYLCGIQPASTKDEKRSLEILKLLLKRGMDVDSVHGIDDKNCGFPGLRFGTHTRGAGIGPFTSTC